jgi:hypothetical protein
MNQLDHLTPARRRGSHKPKQEKESTKMQTASDTDIRDFAAEAAASGFARNFIGISDGAELKAELLAADEAGESWPRPEWLRSASPAAMRGVETGWSTWSEPAPEGAIVLRSEEEQRVWCGNRWFLFP